MQPMHLCDGCDKEETGPYPMAWIKLRVYKRTETSAAPIYNITLNLCSTSCGTRAIMRFHEGAV